MRIILFITLALNFQLFANSTTCSSADSSVQYAKSNRVGGAAPPRGMQIGEESLMFNGKIIGEKKIFNQTPDSVNWDIEVNRSERTSLKLDDRGGYGNEVFAERMVVTDSDNKLVFDQYIICHYSWNFILP